VTSGMFIWVDLGAAPSSARVQAKARTNRSTSIARLISLDAVVVLIFLEITVDILHRAETAALTNGPIDLCEDVFKE